MKTWITLLTLITLPANGAELYRWVDENGAVTYSDLQPPPTAASVEQKRFVDRPGSQQLHFALQTAMRDHPVTLFTTDCGPACTNAAQLLEKRGVPFAEKNAKGEQVQKKLSALTGAQLEVPVLLVGKNVIKGFMPNAWHGALDIAGYPKTTALPLNVAAKRAAEPSAPAAALAKK
ncbi:MAG: glutaredoxin family protein [Betaproteobacteria bacterium]|nr:glutaredoxin family protein [Betaproteobacteria bacterium]